MSASVKNRLARLLAMLVILVSIPLVYFAFRWAVADISAYPVRYAIERWQAKPGTVDLLSLDKAEQDINSALSWNSGNAEYYELKARLMFYRASLSDSSSESPLSMNEVRQALSLHESAIKLRPNWAYSWANKSLMKAYLGEFDEVFFDAIKRAEKTGPWELSANLAVLEAGLLGWRQLSSESRAVIVGAAGRATEHRPKVVRSLLDSYALRVAVCSRMLRTTKQAKVCQ
ncbi:hypothetical protein [Neptunomonas japonica]|uniref:Uncharacterized protein n=1 Tax=Neptunomonas japonica JAMM 1380 TaxID=1441457 RepID=A0A7R6PLZ6_9GAMM|nr:hypothetical protein [Neptunomonas japonica]BBB28887.1 conserved hypothetical protein [Neptunomonas japonica JAMM 1380]